VVEEVAREEKSKVSLSRLWINWQISQHIPDSEPLDLEQIF
jgi:hypothetical protein